VVRAKQAASDADLINANKGREVVDRGDERKSCLRYLPGIDPCERWSKNETEKFFAGLQLFGTAFGMISETLFGGARTRN